MAKDFIPLGDVAARDVATIEIRCDRPGRLSVQRPLAERMHRCATSCTSRSAPAPHRDDTQLYTRCDPYCPTLVRLFSPYPEADL